LSLKHLSHRRIALTTAALVAVPLIALAVASEAGAASTSATLAAGQRLLAGHSLTSRSGHFTLSLQTDGNLVLRSATRTIWASGTAGNPGAALSMQTDGNLVLRSSTGKALFATGTATGTASVLTVPDAPQIVVSSAGHALWRNPDSTLAAGQKLAAGDYLTNDGYELTMQTDGNLVERGPTGASWSSRTAGHPGASLSMQADGNAVIRSASGGVLFSTRTAGHARAALSLSSTGLVDVAVGAASVWSSVSASETAQAAVNSAVAYGQSRGERVAVAVLDRDTGKYYTAGDPDAYYASASVMKVFIATKLLVTGQVNDPATEALMWRMITLSDDNAADTLYGEVGGAGVATWVAQRYGLTGIAPTPQAQYWGLTQITARAMTQFYNAAAKDPVVGPWLLNAMAHMQSPAADGWPQSVGIPSAASSWQVKQGWMCCLDGVTRIHSTGLVDHDRYAVAILTEGPTSDYGSYGQATITGMAVRLLPGGTIPS
jgi:hypothetical protein